MDPGLLAQAWMGTSEAYGLGWWTRRLTRLVLDPGLLKQAWMMELGPSGLADALAASLLAWLGNSSAFGLALSRGT